MVSRFTCDSLVDKEKINVGFRHQKCLVAVAPSQKKRTTCPPPHLQLLDWLFPGIGSLDVGHMYYQKSPSPWTVPQTPF